MYFELYIDNLLYHVHLLHNVSKIRKNFVIRSKLYCHIIFYRNKIFQFILIQLQEICLILPFFNTSKNSKSF